MGLAAWRIGFRMIMALGWIGSSFALSKDESQRFDEGSMDQSAQEWYWDAGGEALLWRPVFDQPLGLTEMRSDGATHEDFLSRDLRFDIGAGYRVWLGLRAAEGGGIRASFASFDSGSTSVSGRPDSNGFGQVRPADFGDIDISSTIPSDRLTVTGSLLTRTVLAEATKTASAANGWSGEISAGIEYSQLQSEYLAELVNDQVGDIGRIDYRRRFGGVGPTLAGVLETQVAPKWKLYATGRTSLLFGRNTTQLIAGEDLDLQPAFTTFFPREVDDFVLRMEGGTGVRAILIQNQNWSSSGWIGLHAQQWIGAGSLHSDEGNLGFWGMQLGLSLLY